MWGCRGVRKGRGCRRECVGAHAATFESVRRGCDCVVGGGVEWGRGGRSDGWHAVLGRASVMHMNAWVVARFGM